jgi:AraC-like DNA-binding protein
MMRVCQQEGFRIPTDAAVISSAAHSENLRKCNPSLTHCEPDGDWLIRPACEYLAELMENPGQTARCLDIRVPGLILGDSTNTLAVYDTCVRRALEFIEASFQTDIDVGDIAKQIHCGRRLLEVRFKKALGSSLHGYLAEKRIRYAKSLIESDPNEKLATIASQAGFRETQAFRDSFLRITGQTPSAWRSHLK